MVRSLLFCQMIVPQAIGEMRLFDYVYPMCYTLIQLNGDTMNINTVAQEPIIVLPGINGQHMGSIATHVEGVDQFRLSVSAVHLSEGGQPEVALSTKELEKLISRLEDMLKSELQVRKDQQQAIADEVTEFLHTSLESPFHGMFMDRTTRGFPGFISTSFHILRPIVSGTKGENNALLRGFDIDARKKIVLNFVTVLYQLIGKDLWADPLNIFRSASGLRGAMKFFKTRMYPICYANQSFKVDDMLAFFDPSIIRAECIKQNGEVRLMNHFVIDLLESATKDSHKQVESDYAF